LTIELKGIYIDAVDRRGFTGVVDPQLYFTRTSVLTKEGERE
jgi:hypothetical protein